MISTPETDLRIFTLMKTVVLAECSTSDISRLTAAELLTIAGQLTDRNHAQLTTDGTKAYVSAQYHARVLNVLDELARRFASQSAILLDLTVELDKSDDKVAA